MWNNKIICVSYGYKIRNNKNNKKTMKKKKEILTKVSGE